MAELLDINEYMKTQGGAATGVANAAKPGYGARALAMLKDLPGALWSGLRKTPQTLALTEMGAGMAQQAGNTTTGAVPENRGERALKILSGADVTGYGAAVGKNIAGINSLGDIPGAIVRSTPFYVAGERAASEIGKRMFPDIAGPATRQYQTRGAPTPAAPVPRPVIQREGPDNYDLMPKPTTQSDDARQADALLRTIDAQVGRGGYGGGNAGMDASNERIRGFGANPQALANLNEVQRLNRTGITGTRLPNGTVEFTNDPNAPKRQYVGADGQPTTNWTDTQEYQSAMQRNASDQASLAVIERRNRFEDLARGVRSARTIPNKKIAADLYAAELQADTARGTAAQNNAVAMQEYRRKVAKDAQDFELNAPGKRAQAEKDEAEARLSGVRLGAVAAATRAGKSPEEIAAIAAGRPITDTYTFQQTLDPNQVFVGNRRTGMGANTSAKPVIKMDPASGKYYQILPNGRPVEVSKADYEKMNK